MTTAVAVITESDHTCLFTYSIHIDYGKVALIFSIRANPSALEPLGFSALATSQAHCGTKQVLGLQEPSPE